MEFFGVDKDIPFICGYLFCFDILDLEKIGGESCQKHASSVTRQAGREENIF